ncbi:MAG: NTP transferase domain-containing protein [Phycisphaerae bacterium]|nr:NTP transferase domain-containing protein [Phycisphaerae bacterium]
MKQMNLREETVCVILAGGRGKRMASANRHKVCFEIAGVPAIVRAIETYKSAGLRRFIVVVGQMAEQVMATVAKAHPGVQFVYQGDPRGTGHAAAIAVEALKSQGHQGPVLIVMGDKITRRGVVVRLLEQFAGSQADLVLTTLPKPPVSNFGRVVADSRGNVLGIVEAADIKNARDSKRKLQLAGRSLNAAQIESQSQAVNASMYIFRRDIIEQAIDNLQADNAQGELYLTDTVEFVASSGRVEAMLVPEPNDLMAFNTPAELLAIEEVLRQRSRPARVSVATAKRLSKSMLKPAGEWLKILESNGPKWRRRMAKIYGPDESLLADRNGAMATLVKAFIKRHGPRRKTVLCRAPARVNLLGRHVDHRGGYVNVMAINREVLLAASPREDDLVTLRNTSVRAFPPREFRLLDLIGDTSWDDWLDFVSSQVVRRELSSAPGDWSHYARAPLLRLQHECQDVRLCGMDCVVSGNIPMGAGLSSSSAMVVAFAEAAVALNNLDVQPQDFVDLCGEGEWFVGSRGGSADHAAIRTGRRGYVSRIGFYPFRLERQVRLPQQLRLIIAHSGAKAIKSADARDTFNHRVACYGFAEMLLRQRWPAAAGMQHLRDLTPERLQLAPREIYRALTLLPVRPTRGELRKLLGGQLDQVEKIFQTHANIGPYDLRGVAMFGISECIRSERFADLLAAGDLPGVGRLMRASHDGDRVVRFSPDGTCRRASARTSDTALLDLCEKNAELAIQPGHYACSTEAIDQLVDIAGDGEGVVGAQLAGAGLGGCMMILVHAEHAQSLLKRLRQRFYKPRNLSFNAHTYWPVAGAGLMKD